MTRWFLTLALFAGAGSGRPGACLAGDAGSAAGSGEAFTDFVFEGYSVRGRGHKGPYFLPYAHLLPESETVLVDQTPCTRGTDYSINYAEGILTFVKPVKPDQEITVRFARPKAAQVRKLASVTAPTELYRGSFGQLKLFTGYRQTRTGRSVGTYGLNATSDWVPHLKVNSLFLVSDQGEPAPGTSLFRVGSRSPGADSRSPGADNTAMLTTATLGDSRSRLTASFSRIGEDYKPAAKDRKKFAPGTKHVGLEATHKVSDAVALRAGHTEAQRQSQGKTVADTKTTSAGVNARLGARSTLDLSTTRQEAQGKPTTETQKLTGRTQATDTVALRVRAARTQVSGGNRTDVQEITGDVRPNKRVRVDLTAGRTAINGETTITTRQVNSRFNPVADLNLEATFTETDQVRLGAETRRMSLAATRGGRFKLTGSFTETTAPEKDPTGGHAAHLEYELRRGIKVGGLFADQFQGSARRQATGGTLTARLSPGLQFRGAYTDRKAEGFPDLGDTREFQLTFTPLQKLSLQAQFADHPAKKLWKPQAVQQRSLRLGSQLSPSVNLSGGYSTQAWLDLNRTTDVRDVRLQVDFFKRHSLYAGLTLTDAKSPADPFREALYSLGYSYRLGDTFSLALDGTLTQRTMESLDSTLNDRPEYDIEGKLRARF